MKLFIDGKEAYFSGDFDANVTFKFLDTYSPSAIKTSYSKTVSLPDCKQNAEIFGGFRVKYPFDLLNGDGRIIEKGYCTLDNVRTVGTQKTYNITLYGGLGDFFYNLKGDEDKPKSLVDLYWGDVTGLTPEQESSQSLMTWDPTYVYNTWVNFGSSSLWDTFRGVPCIYDDGIMDKEASIVPADGDLFPTASSDGSGSAYVGKDDTKALLIRAEENTCYGKQDFRCELIPLGIKYKSIIEACCKPENNGGYEVTLDPDFFNASNPYWNNMFLLKSLPIQDYDFDVLTEEIREFSCSVARAGTYQATSISSSTTLRGQVSKGPWDVQGDQIKLNPSFTLLDNALEYNIIPYVQVPASDVTLFFPGQDWVGGLKTKGYLQIQLILHNNDSGQEITVDSKGYVAGTGLLPLRSEKKYRDLAQGLPWTTLAIPDLFVFSEGLKGIFPIPTSWTNFSIVIKAVGNTEGFKLGSRTSVKDVRGDLMVPTDKDYKSTLMSQVESWWNNNEGIKRINDNLTWDEWGGCHLPDSTIALRSSYTGELSAFDDLLFTKKQLLQGSSSPFEYLTWFTKMFNLRFYLEPGTRRVSILTADNFIKQLAPVNIQDKICYDRDYSRTRKIIDEGYLKFNLEPNKNASVDNYFTNVDQNLLDYVYPITILEGKGEKEYLDIGLKIGSKGRNYSALSRIVTGSYVYYGFNQSSPYGVSYWNSSEEGSEVRTDDYYLSYKEGSSKYEFLTVDDDVNNTVVLYSGLKDVPSYPGSSVVTPAIISKTSVDMVRFAGKPCWITGIEPGTEGGSGKLLGAVYKKAYKIPSYGLVPSLTSYSNGLSYSNVDYESLIVTSNIYDLYLRDFIEKIYEDPLVVECYVRLSSPELRRLYWFDNNYWILTEISNYNYRDEPVKCKFIRYRYDV